MHEMKEDVVLRILARESPKSDLRLKRYGYLKFQGPNCNFGKWLGVFLEIFLNSRVPVGISVDRGLISDKCKGTLQSYGEFRLGIYFSIGNIVVDRVHGAWIGQRGSGPSWTEAALELTGAHR
jgi:hypothetical protein